MTRFFLWLFCCLACVSQAFANELEQNYVLDTASMITYVDQHQQAVWPGYHLSASPTLIHFPDTKHVYAFNFTPKSTDWIKLSVNHHLVYYLDNDAIKIDDIDLDFRYEIDDQLAFVMALPFAGSEPNDIIQNNIVLAHERFHLYSFYESHFPPLKDATYDGLNDLTNIKLSSLETQALLTYLRYTGNNAEEPLKDAVAIHQYRLNRLSKDSQQYEHELERMEGIANYVGFKSVNVNDADLARRIALYMPPQCKLESLSNRKAVSYCLYWTRIYFTEPAIGIALDSKLGSNWKADTEKTGESFQTLIRDFYHMDSSEIEKRVHDAMNNQNYYYDVINKQIDATFKPYLDELTRQQAAYKNESGIELKINLVDNLDLQSEHHDQSYLINTNLELLTNASGDFEAADGKHAIHYKDISLLYDDVVTARFHPEEYKTGWIKFKVLPDTKIIYDGNEDSVSHFIATHQIVSFKKLILTNAKISLLLNDVDGTLDGRHGTLLIDARSALP